MARPVKLTEAEIGALLNSGDLSGWQAVDGKLHKTFRFKDFSSAWGFMSQSALAAEKMDHHPDWTNVYGTVQVALNTHDAGGITVLDFDLARKMNALAS